MKDCEAIRQLILGDRENPEDRKWTLLGQSFGGFCAITYLSFFSEGIKEAFLTGGLAPLVDDPDAVYSALARKVYVTNTTGGVLFICFNIIDRVMKRNKIYYEKYPRDVKRVCSHVS